MEWGAMGITSGKQLERKIRPEDDEREITGLELRKICDSLSIKDLEN